MAANDGDMYFDLGSTRDDLGRGYGFTPDDLFDRFNKPALDKAIAEGTTFRLLELLGTRPDGLLSSLGKEVEYLRGKGYGFDLVKNADGTTYYLGTRGN